MVASDRENIILLSADNTTEQGEQNRQKLIVMLYGETVKMDLAFLL